MNLLDALAHESIGNTVPLSCVATRPRSKFKAMDGAGLFDGFAGYLNYDEERAASNLRSGLVVPDTNVLLTVYKYNPDTRVDMIRALASVGDRLWVPHQVRQELDRYRKITRDETQGLEDHLQTLEASVEGLIGVVSEATGRIVDPVAPTDTDEVLADLAGLLAGRVEKRPEDDEWAQLQKEGLRRSKDRVPPGYLDADKDHGEYAAGDFLVWNAAVSEAIRRGVPLVIITADVKEDWWERSREHLIGPRPELVNEFKSRGGTSLTFLQPPGFLKIAREYLSVDVALQSIQNAAEVDGGWSLQAVTELLRRLDAEGAWQAEVIRVAAAGGGVLTRNGLYRAAGRDKALKLTGWTKPLHRITRDLQREGLTTAQVDDLITMTYEGGQLNVVQLSPDVVSLLQAAEEGSAES